MAFDAVLGQKATVDLALPDGSETCLNGLCVRFARWGGAERGLHRVRGAARAGRLETDAQAQSRIFQRMTVPDILKKVFTGYTVERSATAKYEPRDDCVQYRETDSNFGAPHRIVRRTCLCHGRQRETVFSVRVYSCTELRDLLLDRGFQMPRACGGYDGAPLSAWRPRTLVIAGKPLPD